jgi:hemoglobin-like flavoprotein
MLFYGRLFQMEPGVRPLFKQDIELQGRKLMDMLTTLTTHLDHFEELVPVLQALGQRHAGYGVRPEHYDLVTTSLIWAFGTALDRDLYPELRAAWQAAIELVAKVMKDGAAELPPTPRGIATLGGCRSRSGQRNDRDPGTPRTGFRK